MVAKDLMKEDDRVLGEAVQKTMLLNMVLKIFLQKFPQRRKEYEAKLNNGGKGTVGCVALDKDGKLAVATSTGGKGLKFREGFLIPQL